MTATQAPPAHASTEDPILAELKTIRAATVTTSVVLVIWTIASIIAAIIVAVNISHLNSQIQANLNNTSNVPTCVQGITC